MGKNSKDKRDLYYRKAKEEGWRARSAFKLLQLDEQFHLLDGLKRVVDLCAAPGSWSQVLSKKLANDPDAKIVAVDLQPMSPIDNVVTLQADITHPKTLERIRDLFGGEPADFVCSDGAPDVTGLHDLDEYIQAQLILSALQLATALLRPGGCFVAKIFRGRDIDLMYFQLGRLFEKVTCAKPRSSRGSSLEAFIVCQGYKPRPGWQPTLGKPIEVGDHLPEDDLEERAVAPFIACGDLSAYDSDATYTIDKAVKRMTLDPIQSPVAPPYKTAVEMRRKGLIRRT